MTKPRRALTSRHAAHLKEQAQNFTGYRHPLGGWIVLDAVKAGATGYLLESAAAAEFRDALDRTALGEPVFTPGLAGLVLGEYRRLAAERAVPCRRPRHRS